jgi:5'-methylthioadenosine phosphorylase
MGVTPARVFVGFLTSPGWGGSISQIVSLGYINPFKLFFVFVCMKIGIIGGSGLDDPRLLENYREEDVETKYGEPSSKIVTGKIHDVDVCILARHGRNHEIPPSQINYRANISALKLLGCTHIIATSAVGSLKEYIRPGDLVFTNQFLDFTKQRKGSFYDEIGEVRHESMADPFSDFLRKLLINVTEDLGFRKHNFGTVVVIEGPRFSTRSESFMFRNYADIIGMTTVPECTLAREAGMEYAVVSMSTDYDCFRIFRSQGLCIGI